MPRLTRVTPQQSGVGKQKPNLAPFKPGPKLSKTGPPGLKGPAGVPTAAQNRAANLLITGGPFKAQVRQQRLAQQRQLVQTKPPQKSFLEKGLEAVGEAGQQAGQFIFSPKHVAAAYNLITGHTAGGKRVGGPGGGFATVKGAKPTSGAVKFASHLGQDIVDIPAQTPSSTFLLGRATGKALSGHPKELQQQIKSLKQTSTLYPLVTGHPGRAVKHFEAHPGVGLLEASGAKSLIGRTAGAAGRAAKIPAASTKGRPDLHLMPKGVPGPKVQRTYSKDIIAKGAQILYDRKRGDQATVRQATRELKKRADERAYTQTGRIRDVRTEAAVKTQRYQKKIPKEHRLAVPLVAARIVRTPKTLRADLQKYLTTVKTHGEGLTHPEKAANEATQVELQKLINDKKLHDNPQPVFDAAAKYSADQAKRDVQQTELGIIHPNRLAAQYVPYARQHMGADYSNKRLPTEATQAYRAAAAEERKALQSVQMVKTGPGREKAQLRYVQAKVARLEAKPPAGTKRSFKLGLNIEGKPLRPPEIQQHLQKSGVSEPAFYSQKEGGPNPYYVGLTRRPSVMGKSRTGKASQAGTGSLTPQTLTEHAVRSAVRIQGAKNIDSSLTEAATFVPRVEKGQVVPNSGKAVPYDEARKVAADIHHSQGGVQLVPVNLTGGRVFGEQLQRIMAQHDEGAIPEQVVVHQFSNALKNLLNRPADGRGQFGLIPDAYIQRLIEHNAPSTVGEKALQAAFQYWKEVVLTTSPKWIPGNVIDMTMRSANAGLISPVGVLHYFRAKRILSEFMKQNPDAAAEFGHRFLGGNFYKSVKGTAAYAGLERAQHTMLQGSAEAAIKLREIHGPKEIKFALGKIRDGIFGMNGFMETQPQIAMFGKVAAGDIKRSFRSIDGFFKAAPDGIQEFVEKGLSNTDTQVRIGRQIEREFGRWGKMSPSGRRFLMQYAPFGQWARVALKYVFVTLPRYHPIKTALLADIYGMTDQERKALGLTLFPDKGTTTKPDFLQGSLPFGSGMIRVQGFSSFGVVSGLPGDIPDFILPQARSGLALFQGQDWTGQQVKNADGTPLTAKQRSLLGLYVIAETMIPGASLANRVLAKGGTPAATSTIFAPKAKPKSLPAHPSLLKGLERSFNPMRIIPKTSGGKSTGSTSLPLDRFGGAGSSSGRFDSSGSASSRF